MIAAGGEEAEATHALCMFPEMILVIAAGQCVLDHTDVVSAAVREMEDAIFSPVLDRVFERSRNILFGGITICMLLKPIDQHADSYSAEKDIPTSLEDTIKNWRDYGVFHLPHGGGGEIGVVKEALASGEYPEQWGKHALNIACFGLFAARCNRGTVVINSNWFWGDCYDVIAESEREEEGRLLAEMQSEFLINHFPGFENATLLETATEIGHRWSRTFKGKSTLSSDDFRDGKKFPDVVGLVTEVDRRTKPHGLLKKAGNIPLGILIGDTPTNAIVGSAKNPSTEGQGMIRGQASCLVVGRGAGVAAAVAVTQGVAVNAVDVAGVQDELRKQGTLLDM